MPNIKPTYFFIFLTLTLTVSGQSKNDKVILGKAHAEQELKLALTDKSQHNVIDNTTIIVKDTLTAINIIEPILFSIYGHDNIIKERPYEVYFIDKYWIVSGTLPKEYNGGTFLIILDSRNNRIVRLTHGKWENQLRIHWC